MIQGDQISTSLMADQFSIKENNAQFEILNSNLLC